MIVNAGPRVGPLSEEALAMIDAGVDRLAAEVGVRFWTRGGSLDHAARADRRVAALLDSYEQPPLDTAVEAQLVDYVRRRAAELGDQVDVGG